MCRFLIIRSKNNINANCFIESFARLCRLSITVDGDRQGDGWGVAWKQDNKWLVRKFITSIWESREIFKPTLMTKLLIVHARSAGFPDQKNNIEFNQPFIKNDMAFVFNGMLKGVGLNEKLEGRIGSQKIFSFMLKRLNQYNLTKSLLVLRNTLREKSRQVIGMNIGLIKGNKIGVLCDYSQNEDYFTIHYYSNTDITIICSESFGNYQWKKMQKGDILEI